MYSASHYLALSFAMLPLSALLAVLFVVVCPRLRRWVDRSFTRRLGNHYRDESWLSQGRTATTQTRTRR
jgi:hypothetical protein